MHFLQTLLYGAILIAQVYTALAAPNMADSPHGAEGKGNPKSGNSFANEAKGSEAQVKSKIDEELHRRQVCTRLSVKTRLRKMTGQAFEDRNLRL